MAQLYQSKIWQALLPAGWAARSQYFDCATLFKPDGVGMLQVMVMSPGSEPPKHRPGHDEPFSGKLKGFSSTSIGKAFRRDWWLSCRGRTVVVKYSCAPSFAEDERDEVDEILQSIAESDAPETE
jgi:hypothetical protein